MSFNSEIVSEVAAFYDEQRRRDETEAESRRRELAEKIPGVAGIDRRLAMTGPRLMGIALKKSDETVAQIRAEVESLRAERDRLLEANGYPADYSDVRYLCPLCQDTGAVDGKMCACMRRRIIEKEYAAAGIAGLIDECTFEKFSLSYYLSDPDSYANMKRVYDAVRAWADGFSLGSPSLFFFGNTGLGKTHLAVTLAKTVIDKGYDALYSGAVGLFSDFESAKFRTTSGIESGNGTDRYFSAELLVIDDLGAEMTSAFTVSCLYDLINRRRAAGLPTIITTNLNQGELGPRYTDRIVSRLFGDYRPFYFSGVDVRRQKLMN